MTKIPNAVLPSIVKYDSWIAGDNSEIAYVDRKVNFREYVSRFELQKRDFETYGCVTFSANDILETIGNYKIVFKEFSKSDTKWLADKGYFDDNGKLNFSEVFIYILSGTTDKGNSLENVAVCIRKKGLIPEKMLPWAGKNRREYADKKRITQAMLDLGEEFLKRFDIKHDWVVTDTTQNRLLVLSYYAKSAPLQIAAPVCPGWNGNVKVNSCPSEITQHATGTYYITDTFYGQHDQYDPEWKELALDYPMLWAKRYDICSKTIDVPQDIEAHKISIATKLIELLKQALAYYQNLKQKAGAYFQK